MNIDIERKLKEKEVKLFLTFIGILIIGIVIAYLITFFEISTQFPKSQVIDILMTILGIVIFIVPSFEIYKVIKRKEISKYLITIIFSIIFAIIVVTFSYFVLKINFETSNTILKILTKLNNTLTSLNSSNNVIYELINITKTYIAIQSTTTITSQSIILGIILIIYFILIPIMFRKPLIK